MRTRPATTVLREAGAADLAGVRGLEEELFGADAWSATSVADAVLGGDRQVLVACTDGRLVGYAVLAVGGEVADLERIAVDPAHRRTGVATALLDGVRAAACEDGAARLLLEVSETNAGARLFYAASGAVELARRRRYYRDGADALVLQLLLDGEGDGG